MFVRILDALIPLFGAIICWLLYLEKMPIKKDKDDDRRFYEKNKKFLLLMAVALSVISLCLVFGL